MAESIDERERTIEGGEIVQEYT